MHTVKGKVMNNNPSPKKHRAFLRTVSIVLISVICFCLINAVAIVIVYNSFFTKLDRPDYSVYPGFYDYDRVDDVFSRTKFTVKSKDVDLQAYFYEASDPVGLVVVAPGYNAGADDYIPLFMALVDGGYSVFSLDYTGVYDSGGKSGVGMCQPLVDLDYALNYIADDPTLSEMPLFLIGHSLGGYAAASVLELHPEVDGCALIAPMYNGATVMVDKSAELYGDILRISEPMFYLYQKHLFGEYIEYNGVRGINSTDIPVLIAQGVDDDVMTMNGLSITAHKDEITNPNVTYYYGYGLQGGHTEIWHSKESVEYQNQIADALEMLYNENDGNPSYDQLVEFYSNVDHRLYSEVNEELVSLIISTFEKNLKSN